MSQVSLWSESLFDKHVLLQQFLFQQGVVNGSIFQCLFKSEIYNFVYKDKLSCFSMHSHGKSVLSSTNFDLNVWEGFTNDIKQDLAECKSWLKVVSTCRNINTVMWWCVHKLACCTLEQICRYLNTVNKNTPCSTLQILKLYTRLRF